MLPLFFAGVFAGKWQAASIHFVFRFVFMLKYDIE